MKKFLSMIIFVLIMGIFTGCTDTEQARQPDESLLLDANVMTDYLCSSLNSKKSPEEADFNYLQFVFSCFYYKDQPDFCYYDATPLTEDESLVINLDASRKIMHQVFDLDWDITENVNGFLLYDLPETGSLLSVAGTEGELLQLSDEGRSLFLREGGEILSKKAILSTTLLLEVCLP
ncbi:MAG: hypothetical protein IKJ05_05765, partial [Oscillospiraceae bacterium]|nr:hypothetical protein [Oscillospiraceae bacterium]